MYKFYGSQGWWPADTRLEVIIGAILTQNTAWSNVEKAILNLKKKGTFLSPLALRELDAKTLAALIRPAGYYNVKARRLKNFISFLWAEHGGSLGKMAQLRTDELRVKLLAVNGIGPETCDSILLYAFHRPVFVIDAYTKRIFSRHKFFGKDIKYEEAQRFFMESLPGSSALFNEYHALIVRLAKDFCRTAPRCDGCPLRGRKFGLQIAGRNNIILKNRR